jgi:predicted metal-dependent phosphoesterase TrpH
MRCDLHVHSRRSGALNQPLLRRLMDECYSEPLEVYEVARARGMDLVTLTDHDTIQGALEIAHLPGTFVSEEVTLEMPGSRKVHVGVFDIREAQHRRLQERRGDPESFVAYLAEERIPACLNHPFASMTGAREAADLVFAFDRFRIVESRNGAMPAAQNALAEQSARAAGHAIVGGSDAHAIQFAALTYTVVPGARSREEFLDGLRRGFCVPEGRSGGYARLASEMATVFSRAFVANARQAAEGPVAALRFLGTLSLLAAFPVIPVAALLLHSREKSAAREFHRRYEGARPSLEASPAGLEAARLAS